MDYPARARFSENSDASSPDRFPPKMPLGQFLFEYLYRRGVPYSFGLPGDFVMGNSWERAEARPTSSAGFGIIRPAPGGGDPLTLRLTTGDCSSPTFSFGRYCG
jgi:hypothetical protein